MRNLPKPKEFSHFGRKTVSIPYKANNTTEYVPVETCVLASGDWWVQYTDFHYTDQEWKERGSWRNDYKYTVSFRGILLPHVNTFSRLKQALAFADALYNEIPNFAETHDKFGRSPELDVLLRKAINIRNDGRFERAGGYLSRYAG